MKNLKIIAILGLVLVISYFLFMVGEKKEVVAPSVNDEFVIAQVIMDDNVNQEEKSFATWKIGSQDYQTFGILNFQYFGKDRIDANEGETTIIFGDYVNGTITLSFPGKTTGNFIFDQGAPYMDAPVIIYSFIQGEEQKSYQGRGTGVTSLIVSRWDEYFLEGSFNGVLSNMDFYNQDDQIVIENGTFRIDLKKYPLNEI